MTIVIIVALAIILYSVASFVMYKNRAASVILVDFDSVLVDIEPIVNRGRIYVKNHPDKSINEYIGAHISEQEIKPEGMQKVLDLQSKYYKLVFVSVRHESLRLETAKILNEWGLSGELYMNDGQQGWQLKCELIQKLLVIKQQKVVGILDKSADSAILKKAYPKMRVF